MRELVTWLGSPRDIWVASEVVVHRDICDYVAITVIHRIELSARSPAQVFDGLLGV